MGGKLIIITAPSGAGKTTIVKHLLEHIEGVDFSVSATTRRPRENEADGRDYHFLEPGEFERRMKEGHFVEWEEVYPGTFYGTLRSEVDPRLEAGRHVIFDIDVKGALALKKAYPEHSLSLFIAAPSIEELAERLRNRGTELKKSMTARIARAQDEMKYISMFDDSIMNQDLDTARGEALSKVKRFLKG